MRIILAAAIFFSLSFQILGVNGGNDSTAHAQTAPQKKIEIFVTEWCPYCKSLEKYLKLRGWSYKRYDIEHDAVGMKRHHSMGGGGVPVVVIGGQILRGFNPMEIESAMGEPGSDADQPV